MNEIANVARKKYRKPWSEIERFLELIRSLPTVTPVTIEIHEMGSRLARRHQVSVYDAMVASAALTNNCDVLWSEDMQHGLVVDGRLRIVNPFREV